MEPTGKKPQRWQSQLQGKLKTLRRIQSGLSIEEREVTKDSSICNEDNEVQEIEMSKIIEVVVDQSTQFSTVAPHNASLRIGRKAFIKTRHFPLTQLPGPLFVGPGPIFKGSQHVETISQLGPGVWVCEFLSKP